MCTILCKLLYHGIDEESVATEEEKALREAVQEVELSIRGADVDAALDSCSLANRLHLL